MKRLQRYYLLVGLPIVLITLATLVFLDLIVGTVQDNPHPQINYFIFLLYVVGAIMMFMHIVRINREGALVEQVATRLKSQSVKEVDQWLGQRQGSGHYEVYELMHSVLGLQGRLVGPVEHAAIEAEVARFQAQQQRRLLLAQYIAGMMVGMGLFGTFVGLLGALQEISAMIGGFVINDATDPVQAIGDLVGRLVAPMKSMGVAFSASLFGVLGSVIMGMLLVFVKGAAAELVSITHSRVSWLIDLSKATGEGSGTASAIAPLSEALGELSRQSPLLKGLLVALDQSERRVKQLIDLHTSLGVQLQQVPQALQASAEQAALQQQARQQMQQILEQMNQGQRQLLATQERGEQRQQEWGALFAQQQQLLQQVVSREQPWGQVLQEVFQGQASQLQQLQNQWTTGLAALVEQVQAERSQWQAQGQAQSAERQQLSENLLAAIERMASQQAGVSVQWTQKLEEQAALQQSLNHTHQQLASLVTQAVQHLEADQRQRLELAQHTRQTLTEISDRQEQLVQQVLTHKN